jgi:hypothetical protein
VHVWELETVEHLLDEWCWVSSLHLETINHWNYAAFWLTAWCDWLELVPSAMDHLVVEPPVQGEEPEQTKWVLSYPISIKLSPAFPASTDGAPPPPPWGKDRCDHGGPSHRRWLDSSPSDSGTTSANDAWGPVHPPLELETVDSHMVNPDERMEAAT